MKLDVDASTSTNTSIFSYPGDLHSLSANFFLSHPVVDQRDTFKPASPDAAAQASSDATAQAPPNAAAPEPPDADSLALLLRCKMFS